MISLKWEIITCNSFSSKIGVIIGGDGDPNVENIALETNAIKILDSKVTEGGFDRHPNKNLGL